MAAGDQYDKTTLGTNAGKTNMSRPMGSSGTPIKKGSDPSLSQIATGIMGRAKQNEAEAAQEKRLADDLKQARIDAFKSQAESNVKNLKDGNPVRSLVEASSENGSLFAALTKPPTVPTSGAVAMSVGNGATAANNYMAQERPEETVRPRSLSYSSPDSLGRDFLTAAGRGLSASAPSAPALVAPENKVYPTDPKLPPVPATRPAEPPSMIGGRPAADVLKEMRQSASERDVLNDVKRAAAERAKAFDPVKGYEDSLKDYQASFNSGDSDQTFTDKKNKPQEIYNAASSLEQAKITANSLKRAAPLAQRDSALLRDALQEQRKQRDTVPNKAAKPKRSAFRK